MRAQYLYLDREVDTRTGGVGPLGTEVEHLTRSRGRFIYKLWGQIAQTAHILDDRVVAVGTNDCQVTLLLTVRVCPLSGREVVTGENNPDVQ